MQPPSPWATLLRLKLPAFNVLNAAFLASMFNGIVVQNLREILNAKGLSQRKLAKMSGVSPATISLILRGNHDPKWSTVCAIADALGVSVEVLRDREIPFDLDTSESAEIQFLKLILDGREEALNVWQLQLAEREKMLRKRNALFIQDPETFIQDPEVEAELERIFPDNEELSTAELNNLTQYAHEDQKEFDSQFNEWVYPYYKTTE